MNIKNLYISRIVVGLFIVLFMLLAVVFETTIWWGLGIATLILVANSMSSLVFNPILSSLMASTVSQSEFISAESIIDYTAIKPLTAFLLAIITAILAFCAGRVFWDLQTGFALAIIFGSCDILFVSYFYLNNKESISIKIKHNLYSAILLATIALLGFILIK